MFEGICVGGWDSGVGEVEGFSMGTRLLTAARGNTLTPSTFPRSRSHGDRRPDGTYPP